MATVYVLYSQKIDAFYTGSCNDFQTRILQHNTHFFQNAFTTRANDWKPVLVLNDLTYEQARAIEKHIKNRKSRAFIERLIKSPEIQQYICEKYQP